MVINIEDNPFYYAAAGGIILGIATSLNYILRGKVTGMSGIVYGIASFNLEEIPQKISIVGGLVLSGGLFFDIFGYGTSNGFTPFGPQDRIDGWTSYLGFALAGFLVGLGTKLSNGCTSGHGLCGLARLSVRSLVAVLTFLTSALAIGTLRYHVTLGPFTQQSQVLSPTIQYNHLVSANVFLVLGLIMPIAGGILKIKLQKEKHQAVSKYIKHYNHEKKQQNHQNNHHAHEDHKLPHESKHLNAQNHPHHEHPGHIHQQHPEIEMGAIALDQLITFIVGFLFGIGLLVAGMTRRFNILSFLWLGKQWNPSLLFVLGCGVAVNLVFFTYMIRVKKVPVFGKQLFNPSNSTIDIKLVVGAIFFGLGWGIGGLCPGPFMVLSAVWTVPIHGIWFAALIVGMLCATLVDILQEKYHSSKQHEAKNDQLEPKTTKQHHQEGLKPEQDSMHNLHKHVHLPKLFNKPQVEKKVDQTKNSELRVEAVQLSQQHHPALGKDKKINSSLIPPSSVDKIYVKSQNES